MKPFPCPSCPKSFARAQQRDIHLAVHTGERPHLCAECGRSFASASTLIDHRKRKHLELREHRCPDCPKAFFARMDLESHRRTHTGDKPFQCKVRRVDTWNLMKVLLEAISKLPSHICQAQAVAKKTDITDLKSDTLPVYFHTCSIAARPSIARTT